jgi:mRNA-degrading endonuclease RelE of RelBE toxin-antitoxin system
MIIDFVPAFKKQLKRLSKKYPSIVSDLRTLAETVKVAPTTGISLGNNCYKIRLSISSKKAGKRGGARVVTCIRIEQDTIYFLRIFDKSEQSTITDSQLTDILKEIDE